MVTLEIGSMNERQILNDVTEFLKQRKQRGRFSFVSIKLKNHRNNDEK